jgi:hypothetical protein
MSFKKTLSTLSLAAGMVGVAWEASAFTLLEMPIDNAGKYSIAIPQFKSAVDGIAEGAIAIPLYAQKGKGLATAIAVPGLLRDGIDLAGETTLTISLVADDEATGGTGEYSIVGTAEDTHGIAIPMFSVKTGIFQRAKMVNPIRECAPGTNCVP